MVQAHGGFHWQRRLLPLGLPARLAKGSVVGPNAVLSKDCTSSKNLVSTAGLVLADCTVCGCLPVPWICSCRLRYHAGRVGLRHCRARGVEPPTASLAYQARVYRGCPAGTHPCDTPSRVIVCQSANSVRVAFRVVRVVLCWCRLVEKLR